jgi:Reverse transcriptase (RNA-dependent DNA polymerase)
VSRPTLHRPDPIDVELCPRPGRPPRRMARLSDRDARAWHVLGGKVASLLEARLGPEVVANRAVASGGRWSLEPVAGSFRRLEMRLEAIRRSAGPDARYVATDVEDFFPSVDSAIAARALLAFGVGPEEARSVAAMIEGWGDLGYEGLPIGPPASAVVANAVLQSADEAVGAPFIRWVDDYLVLVAGDGQASEVLDRLDAALDRLGLRRSVLKTRVGRTSGWIGSALGPSGRSPLLRA